MQDLIVWLTAHDKLAGWAQFAGAILALGLTYVTAFAPTWRRKRQLQEAAKRLLLNGYEVIESYHRTSANFLPSPLSVRAAALTMTAVVDELSRFPIFELDNQGPNSVARRLGAMGQTVRLTSLFLETFASDLNGETATEDERDQLRMFLNDRLTLAGALVLGHELKRPEWSGS
ncbi:MAG: hypothetical protein ACK41C_02435 [Phenylobacterium sp.]|uniref:hypothetical protein n=1 Tax=Phenylobacterium sp. TaxID=1871053 RepID=UPI00391B19FF